MPDLRQFRYFAAVAEELHFGRAARRLNIVQPALSMQIKALEEELGATLFLRDRHKVQLTAAGRIFLQEAADILRHVDQAVQMVARAEKGEVGRLSIGVSATAASVAALPDLIRAFRQRTPQVLVELTEVHPAGQAKALLDGQIDLAFGPSAAFAKLGDAVDSLYLAHFAVKLACSVEHPLAEAGSVRATDLRRETFVGLAANEDQHGMMVTAYALPFMPLKSMRVMSPAALFCVVEANLAVAVLSEALEHSAPPNVRFLELEGVTSNMDLYLFSRAGAKSAIVENFIALSRVFLVPDAAKHAS